MHEHERRMLNLMRYRAEFTADDVTDDGRIARDPEHTANGRQSQIGSMFRAYQSKGWIAFTGRVVQSRTKYRHGGTIRVWQATDEGVRVAELMLQGSD